MAPFSPPFPTLVFGYASANACARPSGIDSPSPSQAVSQSVSHSVRPSFNHSVSRTDRQSSLERYNDTELDGKMVTEEHPG